MELEVKFEEINREFEAEFEGYIVKTEGNGGYNEGFVDGYDQGYYEGSNEGYEGGYQLGLSDGIAEGKQEAYNELNDISVALDEIIAMQEELIGL